MKIFFTGEHHTDENYTFYYKLIAIHNIFYKNEKSIVYNCLS